MNILQRRRDARLRAYAQLKRRHPEYFNSTLRGAAARDPLRGPDGNAATDSTQPGHLASSAHRDPESNSWLSQGLAGESAAAHRHPMRPELPLARRPQAHGAVRPRPTG